MRVYLDEFRPTTELVVDHTDLKGPICPVIDFHSHFGKLVMGENYAAQYETKAVVEKLKSVGVERIVNMDGGYGAELDQMLNKIQGYEDYIKTFGTVDLTAFEEPDFEKRCAATIRQLASRGVCGLKFWKILGLKIKGTDGTFLRPDDPRLQCIWQTAAECSLPVLIHLADPVAFFKPTDPFNERIEEMLMHPDWVFNAPELYSFQEIMQMQENLIESNPKTQFVVAHVGSYSENLKQVGSWLDRYPNMMIDIAERINDLGRQPYTAKAFFERYQDRILFGTDYFACNNPRHMIYYRFLETMDEYFDYSYEEIPPQGRWKIYGIGLEEGILKKVYRDNALKLLK